MRFGTLFRGLLLGLLLGICGCNDSGSGHDASSPPPPAHSTALDTWHWRNPLPQGNGLNAAAYANGRYVAIGDGGSIVSSADGISWSVAATDSTGNLNSIVHANGLFVAVGDEGLLLTSNDGTTWHERNSGTTATLHGITFGNGLFVAVGTGAAVVSVDGVSWQATTSHQDFSKVAYGNGMFVAILASPQPRINDIATSIDGAEWTIRLSGRNWESSPVCLTYGNGLFIALGAKGFVTSPDGINWTLRPTDFCLCAHSVAYGNGLFIAVGMGSRETLLTLVSSDGINWVDKSPEPERRYWYLDLKHIIFDGNQFLAVGRGGAILATSDGTYWDQRHLTVTDSPIDRLSAITFGNGLFVAISNSDIITSPDGTTWTARQSGTDMTLLDVAYGNGIFVAVGQAGAVTTSADGITWTSHPIQSAPTPFLREITFGNGMFVASEGYSGREIRSMTSPDGITWTSGPNGLHAAVFGDEGFLAIQSHFGSGDSFFPIYDSFFPIYYPVSNSVMSSPDGVTWAPISIPDWHFNIYKIVYGNGLYIGVAGDDLQLSNVSHIITSANGIAWTVHTMPPKLSDVAYGSQLFVAVGYGGTIMSSVDGAIWTSHQPPLATYYGFGGISYGNGTFVVVGPWGMILQSDPL